VHLKAVQPAGKQACADAAADAAAALAAQLQAEFADVLSETLPPGLPPKRAVEMEINLIPGSTPPALPGYRLHAGELDELRRHLTALLKAGLIRPSSSPYAAPILFGKKKGGQLRLVHDYRALNKLSIRDQFPLPRIDELLDKLRGATVYSALDLTSGYHQVRMKVSDIPKTAFRTPLGLYEFLVMPFGLSGAPSCFSRLMHTVLQPLMPRVPGDREFVLVYLDDVLVFSRTLEEHAEDCRRVLSVLRQHKLVAKPSKCNFCKSELEYLGHIVSAEGIRTDPRKVQAVADWPTPQTQKQLMGFLGLANFYRRFVRRFAHTALPLTALLRKGTPYIWGAAQQAAFDALKLRLASAPVVRAPDLAAPMHLYTDASDIALGAVLMQEFADGMHPIAFLSRKYTDAESRYADVTEREAAAVIFALQQWRHYLMGAPKVHVYTDHDCLRFLQRPASSAVPPTGRRRRWLELAHLYDLEMHHIPGKENVVADALRRRDGAPAGVPTPAAGAGDGVPSAGALAASCALAAVSVLQPDAAFLGDVRRALRTDSMARTVRAGLRAGSADGWLERGGLLYFRAGRGEAPRLYVPDSRALRSQLLAEHHDVTLAGHFGRDKTLERLSRLFYWPGLREQVAEYVRTCPTCQVDKQRTRPPLGLLQPLPVPRGCWDHMSHDLITHLPRTARGHDCIATFVCRLSKMAVFVPCSTTITGEGVARLYHERLWAYGLGMPSVLISDRDPRFTSSFWQTLHRLQGTRLNMSSSFHPETDGQTERVHRTLEEMLRHYVAADHSDWDELLPCAMFAYNDAAHASTGLSPFQVVFGRRPLTPAALLAEPPEGGAGQPDRLHSVNAEAELTVQRTRQALSRAKQALEQAAARQKRYADAFRRDWEFQRGDLVWLSTKNLHVEGSSVHKLDPLRCGPFPVTETISRVAVRLALPPHMRMHNVFHVSLRTPCEESSSFPKRQPPPPGASQCQPMLRPRRPLLASRTSTSAGLWPSA